MLLFKITGKQIECLKPDSATPDGKTVFDLDGFCLQTDTPVEDAVKLYRAQLGHLVPEHVITGAAAGEQSAEDQKRWEAMTPEDRDKLVHEMFYPTLTPVFFELFKAICEKRGFSILCRALIPEIRVVNGLRQLDVITSIDAMRQMVQASPHYDGRGPIEWCGPDSMWKSPWLEKYPPSAARVRVYRKGWREPIEEVATWESYAPTKNVNGKDVPIGFWAKMPDHQLGKCVEARAYRAGFADILGGIYTREELEQSRDDAKTPREAAATVVPADVDSQEDLPEVDEDELQSLIEAKSNGQPQALMAHMRGKYAGLWKTNKLMFYRKVAAELRK